MIAAALSKLHGVKTQSHPLVVATSTRIDDGKFKMDVPFPKNPPIQDGKSDVPKPLNTSDPTQIQPAGDRKPADQVKKQDPPKDDKTKTNPPTTGGGAGSTTQGAGGTGQPVAGQTGTNGGTGGTQTPNQQQVGFINGLFSMPYIDSSYGDMVRDISSQTGASIIVDDSLKTPEKITFEFKNDSIESVMKKLALMGGGYWKMKEPGLYLISKAAPDSALFNEFAVSTVYRAQNLMASQIQLLLNATYKSYISVDPKSNMIGVKGAQELVDKIIADIKKADAPKRQIEVNSIVTEMSTEDVKSSGFSFSGKNLSLGSDLSLNYAAGGFGDIVKLPALVENHKAELRANPTLTSVEGTEAMINVGTDTYFSLLSGSTTFPTSQIQLIHTGVILKYTAFAGDDGYITLNLEAEVSDTATLQNGNPQDKVRKVSNTIRVKSGDTIAVGGLIQQNTDRQVTRVPILGYIPIIGELFTQRNNTKKKIETVIMITPTLVPERKG